MFKIPLGWQSLFLASLILFLALSALIEPAGNEHYVQAYGDAYQKSSDVGETIIGVLTVIATSALALFAFIQVRDARRSSERQLRAYCLVHSIDISDITGGQRPKITITIKNYGQIPALKYKQVGLAGIDVYPLPVLPDTSASHSHSQKIGPGGKVIMGLSTSSTISQALLTEIIQESKAIYAFGEFSYDNGFGEIITEKFGAVTVGMMMVQTSSMANYLLPDADKGSGWNDAVERAKAKNNN